MNRLKTLLVSLGAVMTLQAAEYSGTLPVFFINTEGSQQITSKENYINATYYLDPMGTEGIEPIGTAEAPLEMLIRGRGNYSWYGFDKKPYRIKLAKKQPLLGMNKSKHFALLAHADDNQGFMRNIVGMQLSRSIGLPWTPSDAPVEVVLNGEYIGLYFLTETIRIDKDRVNIVEQADEETNPDAITGGWLVEIDNYDADPHVEVFEHDADRSRIVFTYHSPEILSPQQNDYLLGQMTAINDAIYSEDVNDNTWEDYIDTDQLARYYIVQEIVDDFESFHGSCYLYKDLGEDKWRFGPVWDFGNAFSYDKSQFIYQGREWHNTWIEQMCRHPHFVEIVKSVWNEFYNTSYSDIYSYIDDYSARIEAAVEADARRWPKYGNTNFNERVQSVKNKLKGSARWLMNQWEKKQTYRVYFTDNGKEKWPQVYAYCWNIVDGHVNLMLGDWPGTPIKFDTESGYWICEFEASSLPDNTMIIFGNGQAKGDNQTDDLEFRDNAIYSRDGIIGMGVEDAPLEKLTISTEPGALIIDSPSACDINVADIAGRIRVLHLESGRNVISSLQPGFYIVNGKKVVLR